MIIVKNNIICAISEVIFGIAFVIGFVALNYLKASVATFVVYAIVSFFIGYMIAIISGAIKTGDN